MNEPDPQTGLPPPLIRVSGMSKTFQGRSGGGFSRARQQVLAVDNVSFEIGRNQVVGLVGESGSGKSTVGRCLLRLIEPDHGTIEVNLPAGGSGEITRLDPDQLRPFRRNLQIIFQDPYHSLNPARPVWEIVGEGLIIEGGRSRKEIRDRAAERVDEAVTWAKQQPQPEPEAAHDHVFTNPPSGVTEAGLGMRADGLASARGWLRVATAMVFSSSGSSWSGWRWGTARNAIATRSPGFRCDH